MSSAIAIEHTGLVTSVGLSAPAACAAIRSKVTNPVATRFIDSSGKWIVAHEVLLERPWRGVAKLARMSAMAISECLSIVPRDQWGSIPLLLCLAERGRPGRAEGLDDLLFHGVERALGIQFGAEPAVVAQGRVSVLVALARARSLIHEGRFRRVLIVASDSLLSWATLDHYERNERLLTDRNSNGFIPGEGAGALLVSLPSGKTELLCTGVGFALESAHIDSEMPARAEGLTNAIREALADAECEMHELDFRITDLSGEQYYFKEAALALLRNLRRRKESFDIWHPAECIGEAGSLSGAACLALADAACRKEFAPGNGVLIHMANDAGQRAAAVLRFRGSQ